jgi:hypothetical protein
MGRAENEADALRLGLEISPKKESNIVNTEIIFKALQPPVEVTCFQVWYFKDWGFEKYFLSVSSLDMHHDLTLKRRMAGEASQVKQNLDTVIY